MLAFIKQKNLKCVKEYSDNGSEYYDVIGKKPFDKNIPHEITIFPTINAKKTFRQEGWFMVCGAAKNLKNDFANYVPNHTLLNITWGRSQNAHHQGKHTIMNVSLISSWKFHKTMKSTVEKFLTCKKSEQPDVVFRIQVDPVAWIQARYGQSARKSPSKKSPNKSSKKSPNKSSKKSPNKSSKRGRGGRGRGGNRKKRK